MSVEPALSARHPTSEWPVRADLITLRVCADLDWRVTLSCPHCGVSRQLFGKALGARKLADVPLYQLFERGAFKCRKAQYGCSGVPASALSVDAMDVGQLQNIARWSR